jgi:putative DNA primase/helicase
MSTLEDLLKKSKQKQKAQQQHEAEITRASDVIPKPKDWLWEGHLLRGALELLSGLPGLGKSQVQIHLVACVTAGLAWPDGTVAMMPANVIMLTAEDTVDQEVVPRLIAAKADLDRVHILKYIKTDEKTGRQFLLGADLDVLEKTVDKIGDVALVTIDPITAYMGGTMDSHKATEVRSQLGPLKDFAERKNVAVSAITHPPKSSSQKAIDHFIGSQAFIAAGRIGHVCIEEVDEDGSKKTGRILFTNAKNNPHVKMPTLAFRVKETTIDHHDKDTGLLITAPRVVWEQDAVDISADEAIRAASGGGKQQRGKQDQVQDFLRDILQDGEPHPAKDVIAEAAKSGFTPKQLSTARTELGVIAAQLKGVKAGG